MSKKTGAASLPLFGKADTSDKFDATATSVILAGDSAETLGTVPDGCVKLVITSPPYNIGKAYEEATHLETYLNNLTPIVDQLIRVLSADGSLCWQVGNYVEDSEIFPLDIFYYPYFKRRGLKLRNRIIWHFDHGLHCSSVSLGAMRYFSGSRRVSRTPTIWTAYAFHLNIPAKRITTPAQTTANPQETL